MNYPTLYNELKTIQWTTQRSPTDWASKIAFPGRSTAWPKRI